MRTLGERIKTLRARDQLTQEDLARRLHVNRATLANWEIGRAIPDSQALRQLADAFGVSVDYLLGRTDDPRGSQPEDEERSRELDELLAEEQVHLNGEPLTVEEKEALLAVIKMIKRNKAARQKNEKQDSTPK